MLQNIKSNIKIADDVIAIVAGIATTTVDGVISMGEGITFNALSFIGTNCLKKGVEIVKDKDGNNLEITITAVLKQGEDIKPICKNIQEKVKESIESMFDLNVKKVIVKVAKVEED